MLQLVILLAVFVGTAGVLYGGYIFINRRSLAASEAALARLQEVEQALLASRSILRDESVSSIPFLDTVLTGRPFTLRLADQMRKAGLSITPGDFLLRTAIAAMLGLILGRLLLGGMIGPALGMFIGAAAPPAWMRRRVRQRARRFKEQLPEAIDMLVSAMKAGYSFQAAMKFIGEEVDEPLGPEFLRFYEEQRLGVEVRTALLALQHRVEDLDLRMFVTAVLIQRETGGNLVEVMERISGLMRDRAALKGEIDTLTAESKLSARILSALPFFVFGVAYLLNPGFIQPMLDSTVGTWVLVGCVGSVAIGYWVMKRIADVDV
jgi:tight adherence protein B